MMASYFFFDGRSHVGDDDAGAEFDGDVVGREFGGPEGGRHGEAGLGDAVFAAVGAGGVGAM